MNASPNEVTMIMDAISAVRREIRDLRKEVQDHREDTATMDKRINGRIRTLEQFRWQIVGAAALATTALGMALRFV